MTESLHGEKVLTFRLVIEFLMKKGPKIFEKMNILD